MARKTFISYKYSEAQGLRDDIIEALGADATYYQGETSDSPDLTDESTELIRKNLTDMMYDTSVTIVIVSPNLTSSKWIDWEIEYCLKEYSRQGRTSKTNGVVGVIQKRNGGYSWLVTTSTNLTVVHFDNTIPRSCIPSLTTTATNEMVKDTLAMPASHMTNWMALISLSLMKWISLPILPST